MEDAIRNELNKIGFKKCYKGYEYLGQIVEFLYERNTFYEFNLKYCYAKIAKKHKIKQSSVKGDINYLMKVIALNNYNKKKLLDYVGATDIDKVSVKRLIEAIIDKLFL